jgi:hypothetical protein
MEYTDLSNAVPLGPGQITEPNCVRDAELLSQLIRYRRTVAGSYRALTVEEIHTTVPPGSLSVSPKIDGELWFLILDGGKAVLANVRGRIIAGDIPCLMEAVTYAAKCGERTVIAGELFVATKEGRPRVGDVGSLLSQREGAAVEKLGFAPFDLVAGGDADAELPITGYDSRLAFLQRLCDGGKRLKPVRTESVASAQRVAELFTEWVDGGKAEGLVVRSNDDRVYKIKPSITLDAAVIGYTERRKDPEQVRSLLFALMREDETFQVLGASGNLGDDDMRRSLMTNLQSDEIPSTYRHVSGSGALYRLVKPQTVAEIKVTDLQSQNSSEDPIQRMVLELSEDRWTSLRQMPGVSLLHPSLLRIRDDKQVNAHDVRVAQVSDYCFIPDASAKVEAETLPSSKVTRREVYTKMAKGVAAVRKLLVWKTNKESADPAYPAFVVHWTDYSPGRKDPLKREVRTAPDEAIAMQIADGMIAANIKKGWEPAETNAQADTPSTESDDGSKTDQDTVTPKKSDPKKKVPTKKTATKKTATKKTAKKKTAKKKS